MSVAPPANPRDVQDFQFKLLCRLRVFTGQDGIFTNAVNLVATASKYGLIFVGSPTGIQVISSSSLFGLEHPSGGTGGEITNYPRREVPLPSQPTHLSVSCDQNLLVVAIKKDGCAHALIYSVPSFVAKNVALVNEVRLSTKVDTSILELTWNPGIPNILAACLSDGSMMAYELKSTGVDISSLPPATQANCFCWSPKGKQLVVGSEAGTLTQYKPDLKAVKNFSPPNLGSGNVAVVNVLWLSNYQFAAVYRDKVNKEERPGLLIVNAPKSGPLSFVNYEDICYSGGELRPPQFYLIHQPLWNILMVASANSMEVGVMGLQEDQISWEQWTQEDAARAELPLSADKQETFPVGLGLDTSTQHEIPWGENQSLTPMPVLHILSHQGVLCLFYAINLRPGAARICSPPEKLPDESGLTLFTTASSGDRAMPAIPGDSTSKSTEQPGLQSGTGLLAQPGLQSSTGLLAQPGLQSGTGLLAQPGLQSGTGLLAQPGLQSGTGLLAQPGLQSGTGLLAQPGLQSGTGLLAQPGLQSGTGLLAQPALQSGMGLLAQSGLQSGTGLLAQPGLQSGTGLLAQPGLQSSTGLLAQPGLQSGTGLLAQPGLQSGTGLLAQPVSQSGTGLIQSGLQIGTGLTQPGLQSGTTLTQSGLQSGTVLASEDAGIGGLQLNLTQNTSKPSNTFGFGSALSSAPASGFGSAVVTSPSTTFGGGLAGFATPKSTPSMAGLGLGFTGTPTTSFSTAVSTQQSINFSSPAAATKPSFNFLSTSTTATTTSAGSLKPAQPQAAANFTFAVPAVTSTPIAAETSKPAAVPQMPNVAVKASANFQISSSSPSVQSSEQTVTITKVPPAPLKSEAPAVDTKQATPVTKPAVNNSVFYNAINEEVVHFGRELAELRARISGISVQVGTEEEKKMLCQKVEVMDNFWRELKDTTQALSVEIHSLKSVLMEAFAWTEEAKSRAQQLTSPMYIHLARSQALDPVSARYAANIKDLVYYVENQLRQVNEQLDSNWLEFQESCKPNVKNKMHIPSLEAVYQAMVVQNNILNKQRAIMADIAHRAQEQGRNTQIPLISSAVLARVRDKEAGQLLKGETELSRLAENLVKMKLGTADVPVMSSTRCRRLGRKKESLLREMLSQSTVMRVCPTKPLRSTSGGISTGKPILSRVSESVVSKNASKLSAGIALTDPRTISASAPTATATSGSNKQDPSPPQGSLFLFNSSKPTELDSTSKNYAGRGFSVLGTKPVLLSKETASSTTVAASSGIFAPPVDSGKVKPNIADSTSTKVSSSNDIPSKASAAEFSFTSALQSGKSSTAGSFSFGMGLSKTPSVTKLCDASKRLEDYYEEITPPGTPEHSVKETVTSTVSNSFTFSFTSNKSSVAASTPIQKSPLMSLDSIVAGIGNESSPLKSSMKTAVSDTKPVPSTVASSATFSFSSVSLSQSQQGGSVLGKVEEPKKPAETFKFSVSASPFSSVATSSTAAEVPQSPSVNLKTPFLTTFGTQNAQGASPPQTNIFGGVDAPKQPAPVTSSAASIFAQATPMFGSLATGSGSIFGTTPTTSAASAPVFSKQSTDAAQAAVTKSASESPQEKEPVSKDPIVATTTSTPAENLFSQSTSLFGNLSMSSGVSSSKPVGSIFGGTDTGFSFGKPSTNTEDNKAEQTTTDVTETEGKKSESPAKETPPAASNTPTSSLFPQLSASADKAEVSESQPVTTTTAAFGATTAFGFSQTKPLFGSVATPPTSTTTTLTTSSTSTTFSFSLLTTSPSLFSQKTPLFGQPDSSAAPVTTTGNSFFGQPICSPTSFGQSGGSVFGQPAATTAAKTNIFGQAVPTTTTTPSVFGQGSTTTTQSIFGQASSTTPSLFGQAPAAGSSFLGGGTTGGFGSKPTFGQSGGSLFGQSGSTGFGTSGGSIFGGGTSGTSIFGGGTGSAPSGNLFQPSTGGSIFGGNTSPSSGTSTGGAFSSGMGQSISQSGFGSPTAFQSKPGAFGGSPVFDRGTTGFGSPPTFGGAPTFGGSPTFGSPGKVFGSSSPTSSVGFGSTTGQQSSTFESLASQNTMTFGNLAQTQSQGFGSQTQPVFGAQSQQQSTTFGGSSFSSWR
ncbi:nuclear pore complex protein Nup214 [Periplaneta americana]|uniref:nuclear pore complex protein Nup214 n=1 Tax=Periplaneta americana TaxID=6978 RepID=UPI0037E99813